MTIGSKAELTLLGDVDVLMRMEMFAQFQKTQPLLKLIPREIHQYLPLDIVTQIR